MRFFFFDLFFLTIFLYHAICLKYKLLLKHKGTHAIVNVHINEVIGKIVIIYNNCMLTLDYILYEICGCCTIKPRTISAIFTSWLWYICWINLCKMFWKDIYLSKIFSLLLILLFIAHLSILSLKQFYTFLLLHETIPLLMAFQIVWIYFLQKLELLYWCVLNDTVCLQISR